MKASVKVREGKHPVVRAKLPLNMLGVPLWSGVSMGSREELALQLSTMFEAGPSCRITLRPNNLERSVSVMLKTGFGMWGSPKGAPLVMSAEFNVWSKASGPCFSLLVKPRLGDLGFQKIVSSIASGSFSSNATESACSVSVNKQDKLTVAERAKAFDTVREMKFKPKFEDNLLVDDHLHQRLDKIHTANAVNTNADEVLAMTVHTKLPLGSRILAGLRWRVGIPYNLIEQGKKMDPLKVISSFRMPVLVFDKISLEVKQQEKVEVDSRNRRMMIEEDSIWYEERKELNKVAALCATMKQQFQMLHNENVVLKNAMEDMITYPMVVLSDDDG